MKRIIQFERSQRQRRMLVSGALVGGLLTLSGCVSVGIGNDAGVQPLYVLHDAALPDPGAGVSSAIPPSLAKPRIATLMIQALPAAAVGETVSIAYSRRPHELAFYQLASWNERPVRSIPQLLRQRLESSGVAGAVGLIGEPLQSPWLLTVGVDELVHDVARAPGSARVGLTLALYDRRSGQRLGSRRFDASAPVSSADSVHAAAAMSTALALTFDAIVPWVEGLLPAQPGACRPRRCCTRTSCP